MALTQFTRPDGSPFLIVDRDRRNDWVYARWLGPQTLGTVMEGGLAYVQMLRDEPCARLLNDHSELHGLFTQANDWIAQVWTPLIIQAGLRYFAQVLSPDVFGQLSMEALHMRIGSQFELRIFPALDPARAWLQDVKQSATAV